MRSVVLDASALLAMMQSEPGGDKVARLLQDPERTALVSTLNLSEVFDRLLRNGIAEETIDRLLGHLGMIAVDFTLDQAKVTARLRTVAPALSLADRACLAVAYTHEGIAWTTDKIWGQIKTGIAIEILR